MPCFPFLCLAFFVLVAVILKHFAKIEGDGDFSLYCRTVPEQRRTVMLAYGSDVFIIDDTFK